jgi:hypothetical protein
MIKKIIYKSDTQEPIGKIIKILKREELYHDMIVCSTQNPNTVYQLLLSDNTLSYKPIWCVSFRENRKEGIAKKIEGSYYSNSSFVTWCETEVSQFLDIRMRREDILNQIL